MFPKREEYQWRPSPLLCKRFDLIDPYMGKVVSRAFSPAVFFLSRLFFSLLYFLFLSFFLLSLSPPPLLCLPFGKDFPFSLFPVPCLFIHFFLPFHSVDLQDLFLFVSHMLQIMIVIATASTITLSHTHNSYNYNYNYFNAWCNIDITVQSSYTVLVYLDSCSVRLEA
jgi:hypothetical protein